MLEQLVESGLVQAHGSRPRVYTFSAGVYRADGQASAYVRQAGFSVLQQEQMVLQYVRIHGRIERKNAAELCRISQYQASRLLRKLVFQNKLLQEGKGRGAHYLLVYLSEIERARFLEQLKNERSFQDAKICRYRP
ncbi:MAG: hypothetical protein ABIG68_13450 [Acidobacteriota bacterium]